MASVHELVSTSIHLVTKPLLLVKLSCLFGIRSMCIIFLTWIELLRAAICFQVRVLWTTIIWAIAILSLPIRALSALQREKMLEMRILEMQTELENMIWHRKKLEERSQMAIRECRLLEELLAELKAEHDSAIRKIELQEGELRDSKAEILLLKEVQCEGFWCSRCQHEGNLGSSKTVQDADNFGISLLRSSNNGSVGRQRDGRCKTKLNDVKKEALESKGSMPPFSYNVVEERRQIALSRSFFSAILSLFVGIIVWEARDPCMPLVVALFCVVGISLAGVLRFFSTIENKPAIDAVALLSLNWFMLGTLTYPTLPRVANVLVPFLHHAAEEMVGWLFRFLT